MQNTTETIKVPFLGTWDNGDVLTGYKKLREQMIKSGANTSAFKDFDKYLSLSESLLQELTAEELLGFDSKNITLFTKKVEKLNSVYAVMQNIVDSIASKTTFNTNAGEINSLNQKIKSQKALTRYKTGLAKTEIANSQTAKGILNDRERSLVSNAISKGDISESIKKALSEVKLSRMAEVENYGKTLANSTAVKNYLSGNSNYSNTLTDSDFNFGTSNATLEDVKLKYIEVLRNAIIYGKDANTAQEDLTKELEALGVTINNEDNVIDALLFDTTAAIEEVRTNGTTKQLATLGKYTTAIERANNFDVDANTLRLTSLGEVSSAIKSLQELAKSEELLKEALATNADATGNISLAIEALRASVQRVTAATLQGCIVTKEYTQLQKELEQSFNDVEQRLKQILSLGSAFQAIRQVVNQTFLDVQELDASFGSIAMVTDKSVSELWDSYDQYANMASDLGQSTKDTIAASALFYQQGLDTADALSLTTDSMKLATLSGEDFEKSTSEMTAALRAFHMEMDEGSTVTDVYSELAANAAADVKGIAYAMSKTASIANSAGMEFETTAAFLTLMIETTLEAPENIGTASYDNPNIL